MAAGAYSHRIFDSIAQVDAAEWQRVRAACDASIATDPRFLAGAVLFFAGLVVHVRSDRTLRLLRAPGETGYRIPYGGAFRWVITNTTPGAVSATLVSRAAIRPLGIVLKTSVA